MQPWKTEKRSTLFTNPWLTLEMHTVALPDGRIIDDWLWIDTPDYVNILPETDKGEYLVFQQTKYAIEGVTLASIGGYIESGEEPLEAAQRELLEETGYEAETWTPLGAFPVDMNRGAGTAHFFFAGNARYVKPPIAGDLEDQQLLRLSLPELTHAVRNGEFKGLAWTAVMALGLHHINSR